MYKINLELNKNFVCLESPLWDFKERKLFLIDIPQNCIIEFDPKTKKHNEFFYNFKPTSISKIKNKNKFVLSISNGFGILSSLYNKKLDYFVNVIKDDDIMFNDGKCSPNGLFFSGTMHIPRKNKLGKLFCFDKNKSISIVSEGTMVSNGLAWNKECNKMYWSDSRNYTIYSYDYDKQKNIVKNKEIFYETSKEQGRPDGATVDSDGYYWTACFMGGRILRISPDGKLDKTILMPVRDVTMVTFGGDNLNIIFVTSSKEILKKNEIKKYPLSGSLFSIETEYTGLKASEYEEK